MITVTRHWLGILTAVVGAALWAAGAWAQEASPLPTSPRIDSGDTARVLASSALVLAMITPGLALFYGGWCGARTCWVRSCKASSFSAS